MSTPPVLDLGCGAVEQGDLVNIHARSAFEDTRRKAAKLGAMGSTIRVTKPH